MTIRDTAAQDLPRAPAAHRRSRRVLWLVAASVLVVAATAWLLAGWAAGGRSFDALRLRIATVTRGNLVRDINAEGKVIASNSPMLYAIAAGTVDLKVVAGDTVKHGDVLAVVRSPELESSLTQERATLASLNAEAARAALDARIHRASAQRALEQARIDRQAADRDLQRYQRAFAGGAVAQIDVARAEDTLGKASLTLTETERENRLQQQGTVLDVANRRALADRQRAVVAELQRQVDALTVRAPFDGQVGQVMVAQRADVAARAPLLSVVDLAKFEVEIRVPESFARDLAIGMPAELRGASGAHWPAEVSAVAPEVVDGEVIGRLRFSGAQPQGLRQNQRLSTRIVLGTRRNVLMVERGPFLEQGGGRSIYVLDGNSAVRRAITTGTSSLDAVEISSGLHQGDRVVVSGSDQFGDAQRVRITGDTSPDTRPDTP
jgi:HlyD family secretion protein